ncbi:MAG: hypothetical protein H6815_07750 [Phycisphaeraceae bacterium]|nr:hypothetical protein [Phycisphaerales bacterium]MCB9860335.1 hypothetical protein [Phycisphaeraceae bacterium]
MDRGNEILCRNNPAVRASNVPMRRGMTACTGLACTGSILLGTLVGMTQPEVPSPYQPDPQPTQQPQPVTSDPTIHDAIGLEIMVYLVGAEQPIKGVLVSTTKDMFSLQIGTLIQEYEISKIDRFDIIPSVDERYRTMRALIANDDIEQLIALWNWVLREGREDLAIPDLRAAAQLAPNDERVADMLRGAEARAKLRESAGKGKHHETPTPSGNLQQTEKPAFPVLSDDQINLIKVYEIDLAANPRIEIEKEVIDRMLSQYENEPGMPTTEEGRDLIRRQPAKQQLDLMFRLKARELYPFVEVRDHPPQILQFRDRVHRTWLVNSCASSSCHGGNAGGRFRLKNDEPNLEATYYSNLVILDRFRLSDGKPLINYEKPAESPLLQLGLDRSKSLRPHPQVPGEAGVGDAWRPLFRNLDDRRLQQAVQWIEGMYKPRPDYGIDYTPPTPSEPPALPGTNPGIR